MRRSRRRKLPLGVAGPALGWRSLNGFVSTDNIRHVNWTHQGSRLVFDAPSNFIEGNWDRWYFECQRPYDTNHCQILTIQRNVVEGE